MAGKKADRQVHFSFSSLLEGNGDSAAIAGRVNQLKAQVEETCPRVISYKILLDIQSI